MRHNKNSPNLIRSLQRRDLFSILLFIYALALYFPNLGAPDLTSSSEPRVSGIAAEMEVTNDWLTPRLNGVPFLEKPPLYFWAVASSYKLFGRNEFSARLPSALAAIVVIIIIYLLALRMGYSQSTALVSGAMLATSFQYWGNGRTAVIDMILCMGITLSMAGFYLSVKNDRKYPLWSFIAFVAGMSIAVFSKGLVGIALPLVALFCWLALRIVWLKQPFLIRPWILLVSGISMAIIPVGIWLFWLYMVEGKEAVWTLFWTNNFGRFTGTHAEHIEGSLYYLKRIQETFLPWIFFLPFAIALHISNINRRYKADQTLFLLTWLIAPYLLLNISSGKRPVYLLPLYPGAMLLIGVALGELMAKGQSLWIKRGFLIATYLLVALTAFAPPVLFWLLIKTQVNMTIAFFILIFGLIASAWIIRSVRHRDWIAYGVGMAASLLLLFSTYAAFLQTEKSHERSYRPLFEYVDDSLKQGKNIVLYQPPERMQGATYFYLGQTLPVLTDMKKLMTKYKLDSNFILITYTSVKLPGNWDKLKTFNISGNKWFVLQYRSRSRFQ